MGNKTTFLHYLKNLAITAALCILPASALAQEYTDLVGNTLSGWHLYWGTYRSDSHTYDWTTVQGFGANTGSGEDGITSNSGSYMPAVDEWKNHLTSPNWPHGGASVCAPRFYINSSTGTVGQVNYDPIYTKDVLGGYFNNNPGCYLSVLPDDPEPYVTSMRLGSVSYSKTMYDYATELYFPRSNGGQSYIQSGYRTHNSTQGKFSSAEAASYDIFVTEENSMLIINYAFVAGDPNCLGSEEHLEGSFPGACPPAFDLAVMPLIDLGNGESGYDEGTRVKCGKASLTPCDISGQCQIAQNAKQMFNGRPMVNSGWHKAVYNLRDYIGTSVRILIRTHDCVYKGNDAGGHSGYLYFTARTRPVDLKIKYCKSNQPITVTAPKGFDSYKWSGYNGTDYVSLPSYTNQRSFTVPNANSLPYSKIKCDMLVDGNECVVSVESPFLPANLKPSIVTDHRCNYNVFLKDETFKNPNIPGDDASLRLWYVLDADTYSDKDYNYIKNLDFSTLTAGVDYISIGNQVGNDVVQAEVEHQFDPRGQWVRLYVENSGGCEASTFVFVKPNPVAKFGMADIEVCENTPVRLTFTVDEEYNALSQTEAPTEVYKWERYSNLSSDLRFSVKKQDGTFVTEGKTGEAIYVGESSTDYIHFDFEATDKWGCVTPGTFDIKVNQKPFLALDLGLIPDSTDDKGNLYFKVCPGVEKDFKAYSTNARKFTWSDAEGENDTIVSTIQGGFYNSNVKKYGFGNHYVNVTDDSRNKCQNRIYFNVIYHWDSVKIDVPDIVCPYEPAIVVARNYNSAPSWWEVLEGNTVDQKTNLQSGATMVITKPNDKSTYYCEAFDIHGCKYTKKFELKLKEVKNTSLTFANSTKNEAISTDNVISEGSHKYRLPNMCSTDNLAISVAVDASTSAKHAYKRKFIDADFIEIENQGLNVTQDGFTPLENRELEIIWRTIPIVNGEEDCIVYDTVLVTGYPTILSKVYVNDNPSQFFACDKSPINLKVQPYFFGSQPGNDDSKFKIQWTDPAGGYTVADMTSLTPKVTAIIENATDADQGKIYTYTYTLTSEEGGCSKDFEVPVYISPLPEFDLTAEPEYVCAKDREVVTANDHASGTYPVYGNPTVSKWTFPVDGDLSSTQQFNYTTNRVTYTNITTSTEIKVVGTTAKGCTSEQTVTLKPASSPAPRVKLVDAFGADIDQVCSGSQYGLVVFDDNASNYGSADDCQGTHKVTVRRKSSPINDVMWAEDDNAQEQLTSNALLSRTYSFNGTSFGNYTARNVIQNAVDIYEIEITSPCGCVDTKNYEVPIVPAPAVTITKDVNKNFMCPKEQIGLTASTTDPNPQQYYWTVSPVPSAAGDLTGAQLGTATTKADWSDGAESFYYTAQIFNGQCYGVASVLLYNQLAPEFTLTAEPDAVCENGNASVTLTANSYDPTAADNKYYLQNTQGNYNGVVAWDGNTKTVDNVKKYANSGDVELFVRAGVARYVGSNEIFTTEIGRFCYDTVKAPVSTTNNPKISIQISKEANGAAISEPVFFCPDENYVVTIKNANPVAGVKDVITITDLDDPTRTFTKTVNSGMNAIFDDPAIKTVFEKSKDRWKVSIKPYGTDCETTSNFNVGINEVPVLSLNKSDYRQIISGVDGAPDTATYCVNYYSIFGEKGNTQKQDIKFKGVNLTANVLNDNGGAYQYYWTRSTSAGTSTKFSKDQKDNEVTTADASVEGFADNAMEGSYSQVGTYNHDAYYSVFATDAAGCRSNTVSMVVRANDAPRYNSYWQDEPTVESGSATIYNACVNSLATVRLNEGMNNVRISKAPVPRYTYHAYYADATDPVANYSNYGGFGTELGDEITISNWTQVATVGKGTLKNDAGELVADSCSRYNVRSIVQFPIGNEKDYYYVISKQNEEGCVNYLTVHYNPHQGVDPKQVTFKVSVNDGSSNNTPVTNQISIGTLEADSTVAKICPGDKLVFDFWNLTNYDSKYQNHNPWNYNHNYYVAVEFANPNQGTSSSSWSTPNASLTGASVTVATGKSITGKQRIRFAFYSNSERDSRCVTYSDYYYIDINDSPKLYGFGDDACRLNPDGTENGEVKFRVSSDAPAEYADKHHYEWYDASGNNKASTLVGYTVSGDHDEYLSFKPNVTDAEFGTSLYKDYTVIVRDHVDGFCRSADLKITQRVYNNPDFTITPDKQVVCSGDTVHFQVEQNYNKARSIWQYYTNDDVINTSYTYSMYNDATKRTTGGADANHTSNTFPHYYVVDIPVTEQDQEFKVNAFYNTGRAQSFNVNAGATVSLYCYTVKNYTVHGLKIPKPQVSLVADEDAGLLHTKDVFMLSSEENPLNVQNNLKICPGVIYHRVFENLNKETLGGYTSTAVDYYIKSIDQDEYKVLTSTLGEEVTESGHLEADANTYIMYAETQQGCKSNEVTFTLPLGQIPTVTVNKSATGVCAGDDNASLTLSANAKNGSAFTYTWYNNVVSESSELPDDEKKATQEVKPNQSGASKYQNNSQTYWVKVVNGDGCEATASTEVNSYALPQFMTSLVTENPCENSKVQVKLEKSNAETNYLENVFHYQQKNGDSYLGVGASADAPVVTNEFAVTNGTVLNYRAGVNVGGVWCYDEKPITISTNKIPEPELDILLADQSGNYAPNTKINDATVCPGAKYYLVFHNPANTNNCEPDVFVLENTKTGETQSFTGTNGWFTSENYTLDENVSYRYKVISGCHCESDYQLVSVNVSKLPHITVTGPTKYCDGTSETITLSPSVGADNNSTEWLWTPTPTAANNTREQTFVPVQGQTFQIKATNTVGCSNVVEHTIAPLAVPTLVVDPAQATVCEGGKVELNVSNINNDAAVRIYNWTGDNGTSYTGASINPTVTSTTNFTVYAVADNDKACESARKTVTVTAAVKPSVLVKHYKVEPNSSSFTYFDPAVTSLCPGDEFFIVLQNENGSPTVCPLDNFSFWEMGSASDTFKTSVSAGQLANQNHAFKFRVGETSKNYQYKCVTSCGCESVTGTFSVAVAQVPVVSISGEKTYCDNTTPTITLTANSAVPIQTWTWSNNIANPANVNEQSVEVMPNAATSTYTVSGVSVDGCQSNTAAHTITALEVPTITFDAPEYVCMGSEADVKAVITMPDGVGIKNTVWAPVGATRVSDEEVKMNIIEPTIFNVQVTDDNNCVVKSEDFTVRNYETPEANVTIKKLDGTLINNGDAVCAGTKFYPVFQNPVTGNGNAYCAKDIVELTCISTGESFTMEGTNTTLINNGSDKKIFEISDQELKFRYQIRTSCGCYSAKGEFSVKKAEDPVITINATATSFCANSGQQITLTAQSNEPNMTWNWTSAPTNNRTEAVQTYTPSSTATYHVVGTSTTSSCKGEADITITRLEKPELKLASYNDDHVAQSVFCNGERVTLEAVNQKENDAPLANVDWTSTAGHSLAGAATNFYSTETATFTAVGSSSNGCNSDPVTIEVKTAEVPTPVAIIKRAKDGADITTKPMLCPGEEYWVEFTNMSADATNCATDNFTVVSAADPTKVYKASATSGYPANALGNVFKFQMGNAAQLYNYSVTTSCGCASAEQAFMVNVAPVPVVTISGANEYCNNAADTKITLVANSSAAIDKYQWNTLVDEQYRGDQTVEVTPNGTQTYSVVVTSADGCVSEPATHTITAKAAPIVSLTAPSEVCAGSKAEVVANVALSEGVSILNTVWSPTTGITRIDDTHIEAAINGETNFKVTVNATNGCSATSEEVTVSPIAHPKPVVTLHYYGGDKNGQEFDPATTPLCKGIQYYPVFKNNVNTASYCATETFYLKQGDTQVEFETAAPNEANANAAKVYTVDGGATFFYSAKTSCGCESDVLGSYTIKVAADPVLTLTAAGDGLKQGNSYCEGDQNDIKITVNSSYSGTTEYVWDIPVPNEQKNLSTVTVAPSPSVYFVTGKTDQGCTATAQIEIKQLAKPHVEIVAPTAVCQNSSATLEAQGAGVIRYLWNNGQTTSSITANNMSDERTFSVTGYSADGCPSDIATATVGITPLPDIAFEYSGINGSANVCAGDKISITAGSNNGNADFTWYTDAAMTEELVVDNDVVFAINNGTITVKPSDKFPYKYYVKAKQGECVNTNNTQVKAYSLPNFAITGRTTYCEGQDLSLSILNPDANTNYYWDGGVASSTSYEVQKVTTTQNLKPVTVVAVDGNGCQNSIEQTITVNTSPVLTLEPTEASVCPNESARITASGADTYRWYEKDDNVVVLGYSAEFITPALTQKTSFRVDAINSNTQCSNSAFVTVSVKKSPELSIKTAMFDYTDNNGVTQKAVPVCEGAEKTLQVNGANDYEWDSNVVSSDGPTAVVKPNYDTQYSVTGFIDGCHATIEVPVHVVSSPEVELVASADGVCRNESVTVKAVVNGSDALDPDMNYVWNVITANDPTAEVSKNLTNDFTFTVTVSSGVGSTKCSSTASKLVEAYPLPQVKVVSDYDRVCMNELLELSAEITEGTPEYTYQWTRSSQPGKQYPTATIKPQISNSTEMFTLEVMDLNGCKGSGYKTVQAQDKVVITNIAKATYCEGEKVRLNMQGATEYRYMGETEWTSENDKTFDFSEPNTYPINVVGRMPLDNVDGKYCESDVMTFNTYIVATPKVEIALEDMFGNGVCSGTDVKLHADIGQLNPALYTFDWIGGTEGSHTQDYTEKSLIASRTFKCNVTEIESQCVGSAEKFVDVYETPQIKFGEIASPVCEGSATTLSAIATSGSTDDFTWVWLRESDDTWKMTTASHTVELTDADVFSVVAEDALHGCKSKKISTKVEVQKLPVVQNTAKTSYCSGETVHLVLSGAAEFFVDGEAVEGSEVDLSLPIGTSYLQISGRSPLTNSDNEYCYSKPVPVTETVVSGPSVNIVGDQMVCQGDKLDLTAEVANYADISGLKFKWSEDNDETLNPDREDRLVTVISSPRVINVRVTDPATNCTGISEKQYSVWENPKAAINLDADLICNGETASLTADVTPASETYTYKWTRKNELGELDQTFLEVVPEINPTVTKQFTYLLDVSDTHGCKAQQVSQLVKVVDKPIIKVLGADDPLCQDAELRLTLSGADHYIVNDEELLGNVYTEKMTTARTAYYSVIGYIELASGICISEEKLVPVTVNDNPTLAISGNTVICEGGELTLTASGADNYKWNANDENGAVLNLVPSGSVSGVYNYSVTGSYANGCKTVKDVSVTTLKMPAFTIKPSAAGVCLDEQVTLEVIPAAGSVNTDKWQYLWDGGTLTGATANPTSTLVSGGSTFTAKVTNEAGCTGTASVTIEQYDIPKMEILASSDIDEYVEQTTLADGGRVTLCENNQLKLYAYPANGSTGITSYEWDADPSTSQIYYPSDKVPNQLTYQHTVVGTSAHGCQTAMTVNVDISKAPVVVIRANMAACQDDDIVLEGLGAEKYEWPDFTDNNKDNTYATVASTVGLNTFRLYGWNGQGCRGETSFDVMVYEKPQFDIDANDAYVCQGNRARVAVVPHNSSANYMYTWSNGDNEQSITPTRRNAGTFEYTVTVTDANTGCSLQNIVPVTFFANPELKLSTGGDKPVCRGSDLVLVGQGANEYYWRVGAEEFGPYYNDETFTSAPTVSQNYVLVGVNKYQNPITGDEVVCDASATFPITVVDAPSIQILGSSTICYGEQVKLTATGINLAEEGEVTPYYYWQNNNTTGPDFVDNFTADNGAELVYTVIGMSANGCQAIKTKTVSMRPKTVISIKAPSVVCEGAVAKIEADGSDIISYRWNNNEVGQTIEHVINQPTTYEVTATDVNDCKVTESVFVDMQEKLVIKDETDSKYIIDGMYAVCAGSNIALKVSGASSYVWNNNPDKSSSSVILAPLSDTIYTVEGEYGVCKASLSIPVHAIPAPVVAIEGDGAVCMGESLKLSPYSDPANLSYTWSAAANIDVDEATGVATLTPVVDTKVNLTATNPKDNCSSTVSRTITVNNLPQLQIEGDLNPCENSYTDLTASGALSYMWTYTKGGKQYTSNSVTYSALVPDWTTSIVLWGVDANGCHNTIKTNLTPTKRPVFTVDGATEVCVNTSLQLSANNNQTACTYKWNNEAEGNVFSKVMDKAGDFKIPVTATLVNKEECSTTNYIDVKVKDLPQLYITGNNYPCEGSTMTVTPHGADQYIWSNDPGFTCEPDGDGQTCDYVREVTSPAPFSVQLSGIKDGCRKDSVFTFQVHSSPLVTINADNDEACMDGVVTLTATSPDATTFDWGSDGAGATITPVITANKTFTVTVFDKYGCKGTDNYTISLISSPTLKVYASEDYNADVEIPEDGNISVCAGNPLTFTARGAKTWKWVDALESSDTETFTPAGTTTSQRIQLTGYLGTCEASRVITLSIKQKPDAWIDGQMNVCEGDEVKLEAMGADHYEWSGVNGVSGDHNEFLNYQLLYQPVEGNVKAIADNGCYVNIPFKLTYTQAPELHVATDYDVCEGVPMEMSIIEPNEDVVYVWNDNFSGETFTYRSTTPGTATVKVEAKVRGLGGCSNVQNLDIVTHGNPHIAFSADGDNVSVNADSSISMCAGSDLVLIPLGAKHYFWTTEGMDEEEANTKVLKPTTSSVYTIKGVDEYGCANTRDVVVKTNASPVLYSSTYGVPDENGRINVSVCRDESIDLDITGADAYEWFNGSTEKVVTVKPSYSRTYSITGLKSSTNCPATVEYNVTVNELPDVTIEDIDGNTNRVSLCRDTKFTLKAGGAESYVWTDDQDNVVSRKDSIADYAGESEYYILTGTDANKCVNTARFTINTIETPTITYEPLDPKVCSGSKTTIYGRSSDANSWYWKLDDEVVSEKSSLTITPTADANYTLYGRNKYGCESSIDVPLTVFSSPTIWVDGYSVTDGVNEEINVCRYQPLTLKIVGDANSYEWPSGEKSNTMEIESANMSQKYQVTGYGANNCSTTITIPVHVIPTAKITIKGDQYVCQGSSTVLEAVAEDGTYDNYVWNNNMMGETNEVYVNEDMTIMVTGENSETGCKNTASFPIKMKPLPVLGYQGETNVCKGTSTVIYATGANSYEWQDGSTGDAYVSTPETNDVYKVVGTLDGCSDELSIPITVQVAPVIWADGLKPICEGDALDLVAMGADTYEWSDGTTTAHFTAAPLDDITYTLTGTAQNGCSTTIQVPVTVRRRPVVTANGATSVCLHSTTDLTAVITSDNTNPGGDGNKYRWYHDDELISTQGVLNYEITDEKTYFRLEGIDPAGCANTANITVSSLPLPNLSYTGPEAICSGSEGSFFATGAKEYEWINGNEVVKGNVFKASPITDTYYKLVGISAMGCKAETDIVLVVNQLPDVTVSGNTSVCRGEALDLMGAGAATYLWSNGTTDEHFTATPVATSEYSLTGTDANGCSNTAKFNVTVNELPKFQALAEHPNVCQGDPDRLYVENDDKDGAYSYFWTTEDGTNLTGAEVEPVISWKDAVEFTVTAVNDETHCKSSVKKTIYSNPLPTVGFLPYESVCAHGDITVTAYGADTYEWKVDEKVVGDKADLTLKDLTASTQLYVTGQLSGCSSTAVATITVVPNPIATISEPDGKDYFCNGDSLRLIGSGLAEDGVYEWKANGEPLKNETALYSVVNDKPMRSTVYTLTVTNSYGCTNTATKTMTIQSLPQVGILANKTYVCPGQIDSVFFEAVNNTYNRPVTWYWESVPGQSDIQANQVEEKFMAIIDTTVKVTLYGIDELGCKGSSSLAINLRQKDKLKFRVNPSCIDDENRTVRFAGLVPEAENTKWTWTVDMNETSTNDTKVEGAIVNYTYPGILADSILVGVHAVDPFGCIYDSTAYIYKWHDFWAPDAFSPNGDGLNDRFVFRGGRFIDEFHVIIYDRLGGIVYEGDENDLLRSASDEIPSNFGWDGKCKGKDCPWGVYGYTVTYSSKQNSIPKSGKKRGKITLIR